MFGFVVMWFVALHAVIRCPKKSCRLGHGCKMLSFHLVVEEVLDTIFLTDIDDFPAEFGTKHDDLSVEYFFKEVEFR
jgi:hypothetical protein